MNSKPSVHFHRGLVLARSACLARGEHNLIRDPLTDAIISPRSTGGLYGSEIVPWAPWAAGVESDVGRSYDRANPIAFIGGRRMRDTNPEPVEKSESTSTSLLTRVCSADEEAWKRLVSLYGPLVHAWCRHAQLQSDDLADVFQDIFIAVHRSIGEFRTDRPGDTFRGWLRTIARNKLLDHYRRKAGQPVGVGGSHAAHRMRELPIQEPDFDEKLALTDNQLLVRQAAELVEAEFETQTWRAFWETAVEGHAAKDVASDLGMSVVAVRQAKSRVLRRLREEFTELLDLSPSEIQDVEPGS